MNVSQVKRHIAHVCILHRPVQWCIVHCAYTTEIFDEKNGDDRGTLNGLRIGVCSKVTVERSVYYVAESEASATIDFSMFVYLSVRLSAR